MPSNTAKRIEFNQFTSPFWKFSGYCFFSQIFPLALNRLFRFGLFLLVVVILVFFVFFFRNKCIPTTKTLTHFNFQFWFFFCSQQINCCFFFCLTNFPFGFSLGLISILRSEKKTLPHFYLFLAKCIFSRQTENWNALSTIEPTLYS